MKKEILEQSYRFGVTELIWIKVANQKQEEVLDEELNRLLERKRGKVARYVTRKTKKGCRGGWRIPICIGGDSYEVLDMEIKLERLEKDFKDYPEIFR